MVGPKRHFLPLLLLSLSILFFFSYYHSSLPHSPPSPNPKFTLLPQNSDSNPNFSFIIKVLTFNRLDSVARCLRSLAAANYLTDEVHLHVYVDHFALGDAPSNIDQKLQESHRILEFVDEFEWKFGSKLVHYRTANVGLQAQWLEAWWPNSDNEFTFVVEDDLEVSPLYYKFLTSLIVNYYYNASNYRPYIYGASLQRPRFVPGKHGNKLQMNDTTRLFLYQLVGTWGQLLFPKPWKEFRVWYDNHKAKGIKPFLDGMVTTGWYKKMGEKIWTPWFIKFIHTRGYFNIYTNFLQERALSVSHRDAGVNYGKTAGPDSHILYESSLDSDFWDMQPLSDLKWYDFCFREIFPDTVVESFDELGSVLNSVQKHDTVIIVSLFGVSELAIRNLFCHFERLNIWHYVLVGPESDFVFDLARRGYPVIGTNQFLKSVGAYKLMSLQDSHAEMIKAYVLRKCLESRYNAWVVDGNILPVSSDLFVESDPSYDFYIGKSSELFFASRSFAQKVDGDDFISKFATMASSLLVKRQSISFGFIMTKLLEQKGVKVKSLNETSFGLKIDYSNVNQSLGDGKQMVFWSSDTASDLVQKRLQELGIWIVNDDLSCKAVVCHQS
ncbi:hypothetical protein D8674_017398 [Pyrus ussuriensis x Pyrus communis]|uniref:Uncharacterized protein n=1 Tax=Pyrus ussuriensis x Pyrus communis TaxID=2448454 RepID=A0A5N5HDL9_9ROSA|nr:hypothetical protein D8674_017398 [Pyrus ussuriensis x Pyrus communis]